MRRIQGLAVALCALLAIAAAQPLLAQEAGGGDSATRGTPRFLQDVPLTIRPSGQLQLRFLGTSQEVDDNSTRSGTFLIPRARLGVEGTAYENFGYQLQLDLGASSGQTSLIDASVRYRIAPIATLWMGRGKAPFGREQLTSSKNLNFVDRSIVDQRFAARRQQGVSLRGQNDDQTFEYAVGAYNGSGTTGDPFLSVARLVWTPFGAFPPVQSAHDYPENPRLAVGISGMSSPEGGPTDEDLDRMNVEVAYTTRGVNMTGELFREWLDPQPDALPGTTTDGFFYQVGYLFGNRAHELAGRLAMVDVREAEQQRSEYGLAHSYYMQQHRLKVQTDLRYLTDERAFVEDRVEVRTQLQIAF